MKKRPIDAAYEDVMAKLDGMTLAELFHERDRLELQMGLINCAIRMQHTSMDVNDLNAALAPADVMSAGG